VIRQRLFQTKWSRDLEGKKQLEVMMVISGGAKKRRENALQTFRKNAATPKVYSGESSLHPQNALRRALREQEGYSWKGMLASKIGVLTLRLRGMMI